LGETNGDLLQADFLPASPAVRLTHDFRFASVTGEISGTSIVYLPYPCFMLRPSVFLTSIFLSITVTLAVSQQVESGNSDGLILTQKPCALGPYDAQSGFTKRFYSRGEYESARSSPSADCFRITYSSDGLRVVGYLVKPRGEAARQYPIIIFNRGGFLERGKIDSWNIVDFEQLSAEGFVVLASQYRGNDGGEGHEELGGADLDDVTNLFRVARALPYADMRNVFMYGLSRGGMMTFLEMKRGVTVNAAVVVGAVYDAEAFQQRAPGIFEEAAKLIPEYPSKKSSAVRERSVMNWPEKVNAPLLILHGGDDDEVPATEALAFATKLSNLKKPYQLVVYANDIHEVANNRRDRDARIIAWFKRYLR
jgi:dienelactone hydrolase